ncbi:MAG TPA: hypothetical protein VNU22_11075 [Candidatus Acidoferrum sp.]|nr:hypothetical protein [Candidatus Acidoferrum sp.]
MMILAASQAAHVVIDQLPRTDAYAVAALTIARWALYVAVFTLLAVFAQICIAVSELKTVKRDFALAQVEFDLAQKQFKELTRSPNVKVGVGLQKPVPDSPTSFQACFNLTNYGDKLSKDIMVELLVEAKDYENVDSQSLVMGSFRQTAIGLAGVAYAVFSVRIDEPLYPNGVILGFSFPRMTMHGHVETSRLLFRVYDEDFAYPARGYGSVRFFESNPTPTVTYEVESSVEAIRE